MNRFLTTVVFVLVLAGILFAIGYRVPHSVPAVEESVARIELPRQGASSAEEAATMLFRGVATESPKHFAAHLLLGVCDGPIDTIQKFAECLHRTPFRHAEESFTFYDLRDNRRGIDRKKPIRVLALKPFKADDERVAALRFEMVSSYYGESFAAVDVAGTGYDGRQYQTRIVVARIKQQWYAMPRCRSAERFYTIADSMTLTTADGTRENRRRREADKR